MELKQRIVKVSTVFLKIATVFRSRDLTVKTKIFVLQCYSFSVLLYGTEAWTHSKASIKVLERRYDAIDASWVNRITNNEVLRRMGKDCEVITTIKKRQLVISN